MWLLLIPKFGLSQTNLILNGDCEDFTSCPVSNSEIDSLLFFHNFQICGTSDYVNQCGTGPWAGIPNIMGNQQPHSGDGYVHSALIAVSDPNGTGPTFMDNLGSYYCQVRENVMGTLSENLLQDVCYTFEVYINFGRYDVCGERLALGDFNVIFFDSVFHPVDAVPPTITESNFDIIDLNPSKQILKDTNNWVPLQASFKARGGEKYFAFGTFVDTTQLHIEYINCSDTATGAAYYFMDDFSLIQCDTCCDVLDVSVEGLEVSNSVSSSDNTVVFTAHLLDDSYAKMVIYDCRGRIVERHTFTSLENTFSPRSNLQMALYHYRFETENGFYKSGKFIMVE